MKLLCLTVKIRKSGIDLANGENMGGFWSICLMFEIDKIVCCRIKMCDPFLILCIPPVYLGYAFSLLFIKSFLIYQKRCAMNGEE